MIIFGGGGSDGDDGVGVKPGTEWHYF